MSLIEAEDAVSRALDALVGGTLSDPFAVLGPQPIEREDGRALVVRTCRPSVLEVAVIRVGGDEPPVSMARRHPAGVFEAFFPDSEPFEYRLRVTEPDGHVHDVDDPYRYGRVITDFDLHLFAEGKHLRIHDKLGAHPLTVGDAAGYHFAVWAPNAERVSVVSDFNQWDGRVHSMRAVGGVWEIFIPGLGDGERYKFEIRSRGDSGLLLKADPCGVQFETPPRTASITRRMDAYIWQDTDWMRARRSMAGWFAKPMAIYEVHLGSWARVSEEGERPLTYRELAHRLIPYVKTMGFTHVELLPVMEHPFSESWGYQVTGYFAPTSRFGQPEDFKYFVDACHRQGIAVILDWVPGHFPKDAHGLARFDGTALYEHKDPRQGEHRDWGTVVFNYDRHEVRNFLVANALFWLDEYHVDGLRVDAVASMLYLDYSRPEGAWIPNRYGGRENLGAIDFLRELNTVAHADRPGIVMLAEESTAWPAVSRPVYLGGLGFTYKWNMGWMHDTLEYVQRDPIHRRWVHTDLTFSMLYAFTENFVLPLSHDEVVHGKRSMVDKMPGDVWQKFANLRALYGYMYGHPGKKLLFMGGEFGQWREWNSERSLDWHQVEEGSFHMGLRHCVRDLNALYRRERALHEVDYDASGFQRVDCQDNENSILSFIRCARDPRDFLVIIVNFTPVPRHEYRVGVPEPGFYRELLNTDGSFYSGGDVGNAGGVTTEAEPAHGQAWSLSLSVPPLGCLYLKMDR